MAKKIESPFTCNLKDGRLLTIYRGDIWIDGVEVGTVIKTRKSGWGPIFRVSVTLGDTVYLEEIDVTCEDVNARIVQGINIHI